MDYWWINVGIMKKGKSQLVKNIIELLLLRGSGGGADNLSFTTSLRTSTDLWDIILFAIT